MSITKEDIKNILSDLGTEFRCDGNKIAADIVEAVMDEGPATVDEVLGWAAELEKASGPDGTIMSAKYGALIYNHEIAEALNEFFGEIEEFYGEALDAYGAPENLTSLVWGAWEHWSSRVADAIRRTFRDAPHGEGDE